MMSRKLAVLLAAALAWATTPVLAQTGPNPQPEPAPPPAQPAPQTQTIDTSDNIFGSDLLFILAAVAIAVLITFAATQIGGDEADEPVSP